MIDIDTLGEYLAMCTLVVFMGLLIGVLFDRAEEREKQAMNERYCYQESVDGSYYHYVCSK